MEVAFHGADNDRVEQVDAETDKTNLSQWPEFKYAPDESITVDAGKEHDRPQQSKEDQMLIQVHGVLGMAA